MMNLVWGLDTADKVASVVAAVIAVLTFVPLAARTFVLRRRGRSATAVQHLDRLAEIVAAQWRDEMEIQGINTPWTAVGLPSNQRLVVVGPAGSGKSVAAIRLLRELLNSRAPGGPVPVLFALHSWNPSAHPHRWMAAEVARTYGRPFPIALELLRARQIVPVLDGLDETSDPSTALHALNRLHDPSGPDPLILTSRERVELTGATLVKLKPVRVPGWEMLSTPLLVSLAIAGNIDPADLTGLTEAETEQQLFARFVPAVYANVPRPDGRRPRWKADRAEEWLRFLARQPELSWWELIRATPRVVLVVLELLVVSPLIWLGLWLVTDEVRPVIELVSVALTVTVITILRPYPEASRLRAGSRPNPVAVLGGFGFGFVVGLLAVGLAAAFATGMVSALICGLMERIDTGAEPREMTPTTTLRSDRIVTIIITMPFPVLFATLALFAASPGTAALTLLTFWIYFGILPALMSAWTWFGLTRVWLALTGKTPLRLITFLDDAHRRGVLRRSGPIYEFRHAHLRAYLRADPPVDQFTASRTRLR